MTRLPGDDDHSLGSDVDGALVNLILQSVADGVFAVDEDFNITYFNTAAEEITGFDADVAVGLRCSEVFRTELCRKNCPLEESLRTGRKVTNRSIEILTRNGEQRTICVSTAALVDGEHFVGAVEAFRDVSRIEALERLAERDGSSFEGIIGRSAPMQRIFALLPTIARSDATVLIEGESGTGKGLFARAIHDKSLRSAGPFIHVNCGALPETLLEAELFGHVPGAFTGATSRRIGRFGAATGGTIFLDEIGDAPLATQVKLLHVLQDRKYQPVGSSESLDADVRVIAATNQDLTGLVREGRFREDLYYRLKVLHLRIPELRTRMADVQALVDAFVDRYNKVSRSAIRDVSPEAMRALMEYGYPGNVRELENIVQHMCIVSRGGCIEAEDLPSYVFTGEHAVTDVARRGGRSRSGARKRVRVSNEELRRILAENEGNLPRTAEALGVHRTTLWRWVQRLNLQE